MNQKVLYSMMGLAALPIGAEAAVVQAYQLSNWEGTGLTVANGLISSDGTQAKYTIPQLLPGKYKLVCSLTTKVYNVDVEIAGVKKTFTNNSNAQNVEIEFTLNETKDVTLTFTSSDPGVSGSEYAFTAPVLSLDFDFAAIKTTLVGNAQTLIDKINGYNYAKEEDVNAANALKTKAEGIAESYDDYKKFKLYADKSTIQEEIDALDAKAAAAEAAYQNEQAYNRVNAAITTIKAKYNAAVSDLEETLVGVAAYLLDDAKADLNENINKKITEATQASYASYQAGTAVADEATNTANVPTEEALNDIVNNWKAQGATNVNAYNALHARVTALQGQLDAIAPNAAIASQFDAEKGEAQNAINAVDSKVEGAKNSAAQLTLNIDAEEATAQGKINTLAGKVNTANAEYTAWQTALATITTLQDNLNNAKTTVNAKVSADGNYKAQDYYTAYVTGVQGEIDGFKNAADKAYNTDHNAVAYNAALDVTATQAKIDTYKAQAVAAVDKYDDLQDAITDYQADLDAARAQVENLDVYKADGYDYKTKFDLIQKRINDIKKAIEAAKGKVGVEHWTAMLAIDDDDAITNDIATLCAQVQGDQNEYDVNVLETGIATLDGAEGRFAQFETTYVPTGNTKLGDDYATYKAVEDGIKADLADIVAAKNAINANSETVDYTAEVGTGDDKWTVGSLGHTGSTPRTPAQGNFGTFQLIDQWNGSVAGTGTALVQQLSGLPNGKYTVELYASAVDQSAGCPNKDKLDIAFVYANGVETPVKVTDGATDNAYTLSNVSVTNGTLEMGLKKKKDGTNWHLIQIKSLIANTASLIQNWGAEVADLNAQQDVIEAVAAEIAAKVAKNSNDKATTAQNIDGLQTKIGNFKSTYKIGQDDSTLGNRGKATGSVTTQLTEIETNLATLEGNNNAVVPTAVTPVNKTTAVGTENSDWVNGEVPSNAGNNLTVNDMHVPEQWGYSANTGTVLVQTVNNLPNGKYTVELYAFASQGTGTPGDETAVHVYANGKTTPVKVSGKKGDGNWPQNASDLVSVANGFDAYTIDNVLVTDGTLKMGITKDKAGTQWHGIQIKSLTYSENTNADLATYANTYSTLASQENALEASAPGIKAEVEANASTYATANTAISDLQTAELNTLKSLANVTDENAVSTDAVAKKADPADFKVFETGLDNDKNYTAKKAAIDADIAAMQAAINASNADETMVSKWKNNSITVNPGEDNEKTYSIATITGTINDLKAEAVAESDNYEAYKAVKEGKYATLDAINVVVTDADAGAGALTFYQGLVTQYATDKANILASMQASLNARKAVADKSTFENDLTTLTTKVNAVVPDAKANLAKYNDQVQAYTETQNLWNATYTEIAALDHSSKVQDWLDQLDAIQVDLTAATEAVEANYPVGKSVAEAKDFAAIQGRINDVKAQQSEGYNAAIAADNKAAHETFMGNETTKGTIQLATEAYQTAVQERAKYSSTNADIEAAVTAAAATLDAILYNCPTEIATLTNAENTAYTSTLSPDLFDVDPFNTQATAIEQNIVNALNQFKTDVAAAIGGYWATQTAGYDAKVAAAKNDIATYSDGAKTDAFKDVEDLIAAGNAAVAAMNLAGVESAVAGLEDIDDMLAADKNEAANKDIQAAIAERDTDADKATLNGYADLDAFDEAAEWVAEAEDLRAGGYAAGTLFDDHDDIMSLLNDYTTEFNAIKAQGEADKAADEANTAAYGEMTAALGEVEAKLTDAKEATAAYKYATSFATDEATLSYIASDADDYFNAGTAVANKNAVLADVDNLNDDIEFTLTTAFNTEKAGLAGDIAELKNQYNTYVAANGLDETANGFNTAIDALEAQLATIAIADLDDPADGIQYDEILAATEALIELQGNIADLQTELLEANASTANADVLASFNSQLDELATAASLEGIDAWVGEQDAGNGKTIAESVAEISNQIEELRSAIHAEDNISFYKKQYQEQIDAIEATLTPVAEAIEEYQAQFTANAEAYEALTAELDRLQGLVDAAKEKVSAYEYAANTYSINNAQQIIDDASDDVELGNEYVGAQYLNIDDYVDDAEWYIQAYLDMSAYAELKAQKNALNTALTNAIDIANHEGVNKYSSALWARLIDEKDEIDGEIKDLDYEIWNSYQLWESTAKNTWVYDNNNQKIAKARTSDADYEAQMATVAAIQAEIDDLADAVDNLGLLGDANEDGKVNVLDYQKVLNMILDPTLQPEEDTDLFANIDINQSEVIEVGDLTAIVNNILTHTWTNGYAAVKSFGGPANESLTMTVSEMQQGVQRLAVNLENVEDYTAFQLDMVLPEGMTIVGTSLSNRAGESHKLYSRTQQDGSVRLLASSIKGESFSGNEGAVLYIDVKTTSEFKGGSVELLNILFSDVFAQTRAFAIGADEATGIDFMATMQSLKQKVYDLSGRMTSGLKKGVNIILRNDGTSQKVLK